MMMMPNLVTCPLFHTLLEGPSTDGTGVVFTCDACGCRTVDDIAVSCRVCGYDLCRACYTMRGSRSEDIAQARARVIEAQRALSALRESEMVDEECWC